MVFNLCVRLISEIIFLPLVITYKVITEEIFSNCTKFFDSKFKPCATHPYVSRWSYSFLRIDQATYIFLALSLTVPNNFFGPIS